MSSVSEEEAAQPEKLLRRRAGSLDPLGGSAFPTSFEFPLS
jgi:hypothetical protein